MLSYDKLKREILETLKISPRPFFLGITGAMAVGKTTFSLALKKALEEELEGERITLISTDGFLYSNAELTERNLWETKGSPRSFHQEAFLSFLSSLRKGEQEVWEIPFYDHKIKDIHPQERQEIRRADIYLLEGINLLFPFTKEGGAYDRLILLDKEEAQVYQQFRSRFLRAFHLSGLSAPYFRDPAWHDPKSREARLESIWQKIHVPFYKRWVLPLRSQADWVVSPSFDPTLL